MEYSVQKILDKMIDPNTSKYKLIQEKQLYLIKWQGYDISYASWEPYQHVKDNCQALLAQFEAKFGNIITTAIGKIYVPLVKNNNDKSEKNIPKISRTMKIKKQSKRQLVRLKTTSQLSQNSIRVKNQRQLNNCQSSKKLQHSAKSLKFHNLQQPKNVKIFQDQKDLFSNFRPVTRRNSLNLIQTNSNASQRKNSIRDKQLNSIKKRIDNNQEQQRNSRFNSREGQRKVKRFTPIIIQNVVQKSSRKISMHQQQKNNQDRMQNQNQNQNKKEKEKEKYQRKQSESPIDIIGMRKSEEGYQFYVNKNGKNYWSKHSQIFNNHSKELCKFYERNLILQ